MPLFVDQAFIAHAGSRLPFKIECDALTDEDIETLAKIIGGTHLFGKVHGVPQGGMRLAAALQKHCLNYGQTLIVDDVLTTGTSMEEARRQIGGPSQGVVIFARGNCPSWIKPIFQLSPWAGP